MAKKYGFRTASTNEAIIYETGTPAESVTDFSAGIFTDSNSEGWIVSSSEWGFITEDNGRRICAALQYFSETPTEEIERLANERFPDL